ncbi:MAG: potassium-transporting ATPase subunit KdpC [Phycisphaerae bacterium]|jgi:K+-transporting ATPase ATPase C chain
MLRLIRQVVVMLVVLSAITGLIYPLVVTGIAQLAFHRQANGSVIVRDGKAVGSHLIGQSFSDPKYFWSRPSATTPVPYNAANSSGSNLGPLNPALADNVKKQAQALRSADPANAAPIPVDLVTSSGSGLDPHISVAAALYQVPRVARVRGLAEAKVRELVTRHIEDRQFAVLGEKCVNVLKLNLDLEGLE